jgi:hypothetical protein
VALSTPFGLTILKTPDLRTVSADEADRLAVVSAMNVIPKFRKLF